MRKTWWHYSHSRLSVSYIALYALTTVYIWTPDKCIIESYISSFNTFISHWVKIFPGLTLMGLLALGLVWPPCIPAMSRLWLLCWSPSTAMAPGHPSPASRKQNSLTGPRSELNGFHWITVHHPVFIASIPLITCPYPGMTGSLLSYQ